MVWAMRYNNNAAIPRVHEPTIFRRPRNSIPAHVAIKRWRKLWSPDTLTGRSKLPIVESASDVSIGDRA